MQVSMLSDLLLVKRLEPSEYKSSGGILLPEAEESNDTPYRGVVIAAGPGKAIKSEDNSLAESMSAVFDALRHLASSGQGINHNATLAAIECAEEALQKHHNTVHRLPMNVKVGDTVIYSRNLTQEFKIDGQVYISFGQNSVLGILED